LEISGYWTFASRLNDDRIILWGQSCVGKTTFAQTLKGHHYYCFDALFSWYDIETLGLPVTSGLEYISKIDSPASFVMDGWTLVDCKGNYLPKGSVVYVIYAPYKQIIDQYRVPVADFWDHFSMFRKWYCDVDYEFFPNTKYILNDGREFTEQSRGHFEDFISQQNL